MGLFEKHYQEIVAYLDQKRNEGKVSEYLHTGITNWPSEKNRNLVLGQDTAVELGNPKDASTSFLLWVNQPDKIKNDRISIVGPDLPQLNNQQVSFGKVVIIGGSGFDAENSYDRYREMELLRYDVHLNGYMMRGVSQHLREWSRVSKEAVQRGFSFHVLGGALIDKFMELDYVHAVETIFITSCREDVLEMKSIADGVSTLISAMNKMVVEMSFDCDDCEYNDVCDDVAELRSMHNALKKNKKFANAAL
jgi:CO dehydrogenase/acetyl-CoA synthase beta subunit